MKQIFVVLSIAILMISCNADMNCGGNKDKFLVLHTEFVKKISEAEITFSDESWTKYDAAFEQFTSECYPLYKAEMTETEKRQFWVRSMQYQQVRNGSSLINSLFGDNSELKLQIEEGLKESWGSIDEAVTEIANELKSDEVQDLLKDISKDVEKWGKDFEEIGKKFEDILDKKDK